MESNTGIIQMNWTEFAKALKKSDIPKFDIEIGLDYENGILLVSPLTPNGMNYWIHWDLNIGAPVSKFMYTNEANSYLMENKLWTDADPLNMPPDFKIIKIVAVNKNEDGVYSMMVDYILKNNTAGTNGEHLTWDQIIELYR
jgi:hypothetical protein